MRRPRRHRPAAVEHALRLSLVALMGATMAGCPKRATDVRGEGRNDQVELHDTLPGLIEGLRASREQVPEGPRLAWLTWEQRNRAVLASAGALSEDPGDQLLGKLAVSPDALLSLLEPFSKDATPEARALIEELERRIGQLPPTRLVFAAARTWQPVFRGSEGDVPVILLNARAPELSSPGTRRTTMARELFAVFHQARVGDVRTVGPLARQVHREGAAVLAVRTLVPDAQEHEVLELEPQQLNALRARQTLLARELLAAIDSGSEAEAARFFSREVKDPLLPRGAGRFIADRLYQRLAREMGSLERPLRITPSEFIQRARPHLAAMARGTE